MDPISHIDLNVCLCVFETGDVIRQRGFDSSGDMG
jgi:hypothetical protein